MSNVAPPTPVLSKSWSLLSRRQTDQSPGDAAARYSSRHGSADSLSQRQAGRDHLAHDGQSLAQLEQSAKVTRSCQKPDLVLLAVPRAADAQTEESFVRSYSDHELSLSFGLQEWDCCVMHPA